MIANVTNISSVVHDTSNAHKIKTGKGKCESCGSFTSNQNCICLFPFGSIASQRQDRQNKKISCVDRQPRFHPAYACSTSLKEISGDLSAEDFIHMTMGTSSPEAFVWRKCPLIAKIKDRWTFDYLDRTLPSDEKYGCILSDTNNIFRFQNRKSRLPRTNENALTFSDFRQTKGAYLQFPLLWRDNQQDNGKKGPIGDLYQDLLKFDFAFVAALQRMGYPLLKVMQLFVSTAPALSYCHFDEQPNLFCQIHGSKRWLLFDPADNLVPYGPTHTLARRSSLDLLQQPPSRLLGRGKDVTLGPGDVLYVPSLWWHHVASINRETVSLALWFFGNCVPRGKNGVLAWNRYLQTKDEEEEEDEDQK